MAAESAKAAPEPEVEEVADNVELTDPDDIDALMDSMAAESAKAAPEPAVEEVADNVELTDPDDIDALMDSMAAQSTPEPAVEEVADNVELTDPDDIDALMDSMAGISPSEPTPAAVETVDAEEDNNQEQINNFTEEYVAPFLAADFSDIGIDDNISKEEDDSATLGQESIEEEFDIDALLDSASAESSDTDEFDIDSIIDDAAKDSDVTDEIDIDAIIDDAATGLDVTDELDIDALIDSVASESDVEDELDIDALIDSVEKSDDIDDDLLDIGDDILAGEDLDSPLEEHLDIDESILADVASDFDESTLTQLLNDEKQEESEVELSPDFTDSNVLADLLSEDDAIDNSQTVDETNESKDIEDLDSLDFDELLANIEEDAPSNSDEELVIDEELEIIADDSNEASSLSNDVKDELEETDFISVDSLISDTLSEDDSQEEPYEQTNIDVGLGDFPEFTSDVNQIDVDEEDDNGAAAKLDLAKVYLEIGDSENAEVILSDVVKMGDAEQQDEAQQLLDKLN